MTAVHWPDDTRIRERLIRTLASGFDVAYAARSPGPSDTSGLDYIELRGGRVRRNLEAIWLGLTHRYNVLVVHDPELLVGAVLARLVRRRPVVFDVHEDVPASAYTRAWVPSALRKPLSLAMAAVLRLVEPILTITLAEPGYRRLFAKSHPCFPNYPDTRPYPKAGGDPSGPVLYLGDVTAERGIDVAVEACSRLGVTLRLIGRISPETRSRLEKESSSDALIIEGPVPNRTAVELLTSASVGLAPLLDLPNYRHSQPTKILEYLAVGLPVAASDLPGTRELVAGLDSVFLAKPGDVGSLSNAIAAARRDEATEKALAQADAIRSRFTWPSDEVRAFYEALV
jgi:glycosyltransferase involved in cell wall biosynthesis